MSRFDVVVVGAGHAGCEAAAAAAAAGAHTALVTLSFGRVGHMPCNPAVGGPGKSQLVREIDALGGWIARMADATALGYRLQNTSKGAASRVRRAQVDRHAFERAWGERLRGLDGVELVEASVEGLLVRNGRVRGVRLAGRGAAAARAVVLCPGTFLRGEVLIGGQRRPAGRDGEPPAVRLAESLHALGLAMMRLNTGTTPRVDRTSVDLSSLELQQTSDQPMALSFWNTPRRLPPDHPVAITQTNPSTHEIVRRHVDSCPLGAGMLTGPGPRHCPSLELKVARFPERRSHRVFIEPEGRHVPDLYLQGVYTAMPPDVQERIVHSIEGLERSRITRFGYDIEYDAVDPRQLRPTLEVRSVAGLFLAGQVNGTTGYEEAAAQGLVAGVNAARRVRGQGPFTLSRGEAFVGVLIDDLVVKGITEPYRMLPSRAEYRLTLREGNADRRLSAIGHRLGLLADDLYEAAIRRSRAIDGWVEWLRGTRIGACPEAHEALAACGSPPVDDPTRSLFDLLKRPELRLAALAGEVPPLDVAVEVEIEAKYEGYLQRQARGIARLRRLDAMPIPADFDFDGVHGLSVEGQELLAAARPESYGAACRTPGVSQSDLAVLGLALRGA